MNHSLTAERCAIKRQVCIPLNHLKETVGARQPRESNPVPQAMEANALNNLINAVVQKAVRVHGIRDYERGKNSEEATAYLVVQNCRVITRKKITRLQ